MSRRTDLPKEDLPRDLLLSLAADFGIHDEVAELMEDCPPPPLSRYNLRELLEKVRKLKGWSRTQLARRIGTSTASFDDYADTYSPRLEKMARISTATGLPFIIVLFAAMRSADLLPPFGERVPRVRYRQPKDTKNAPGAKKKYCSKTEI